MSLSDVHQMSGGLWPLLVVVVIGFLPTEMWRVLAIWMARDLKEDSPVLAWVRYVASALLAAVVAKIILAPTGAMQLVPLWWRIGAIAVGFATLAVTRRNVIAAVLMGEATVVLAVMLSG